MALSRPGLTLIFIPLLTGCFLLLLTTLYFDLTPQFHLISESDNLNPVQHKLDILDKLKMAAHDHVKAREHERAIPILKELYKIQVERLGSKNKETVETLDVLAGQTFQAGKLDEGLSLSWRVYKTKEKTLGPAHPQTLHSLLQLAQIYQMKGKYEKAAEFAKVVYRQRKLLLGAENLKTVEALSLLAVYLGQAGPEDPETKEKVLQYYKKVHKVYSRTSGEEERTLAVLLEIGKCLVNLKRFDEAISTFHKIMKATENRPSLSKLFETAENRLGSTLRDLGRTEEARQIHRRARRIKSKTGKQVDEYDSQIKADGKFTPEVEDQIHAVLNLGKVAMVEGNYEKALEKLEQLYSILQNDHPKRMDVVQFLMEAHGGLGHFKKALELSIELFYLDRKPVDWNVKSSNYFQDIARTWQNVFRYYMKVVKEDPKEAKELFSPRFKEISEIFVKKVEPELEKWDEADPNPVLTPKILKLLVIAAWFCGRSEVTSFTASKLLPILERERDAEPKPDEEELKKINEVIELCQKILGEKSEKSSSGGPAEKHVVPNNFHQHEL